MKKTIAIMGPTGAGKDTQARFLVEQYDYHIIDAGNLVRSRMKTDPEAANRITHGLLVDDQIVNDMVAAEVDTLEPTDRMISDGFPRRLLQAQWFDQFLAELGRDLDGVVYLHLDPEVVLARLLKRGRLDDQPDVVRQRLAVFEAETLPVIKYYQKRDLVCEIDGNLSVSQVHHRILEYLQ